jgi:hypothetical protein
MRRAWILLVPVGVMLGCSAESTGWVDQRDTVGQTIANIAVGQLGGKACSPQVYDSSCTGNGGSPEYWCADFARWVWEQAGVANTSELTAAAGSFYVYGQKHNTLHDSPSVGDAVVFDYGGNGYADHVALVTQVNGDGTIEAVSGDWGGSGSTEAAWAGSAKVALNAPAFSSTVGTTPSVIGMKISGYISPVGGGGGGGGGNNGACSGYMDGLYCGGDYISGDSSTLYRCTSGNLTVAEQCQNGCQVMPTGQDDQCAAASSSNGGCAGYYDGLYCGGDYVSGDSSTLYRCTSGNLTVEQVCQSGCQVMPNGQNDQCASASNGGCAGYYDGLYCGGDYISGDPSTLYQCSGGNLSVYQSCAYGCEVMSDGTNDRCY